MIQTAALLAFAPAVIAFVPGDWYVDAAANCAAATGTQRAPFCTIGAAVATSSDGDTIHVAPGTYPESVAVRKDLEIIGTRGPAQTIVDGSATSSVFRVFTGTSSVLRGLTIQNANNGGGVSVDAQSGGTTLVIDDCRIVDNTALSPLPLGGGIYARNATLTLIDSTVQGNVVVELAGQIPGSFGAGVYLSDSTLTMERCVVADNRMPSPEVQYGAGLCAIDSDVIVRDSIFRDNVGTSGLGFGGGIASLGSVGSLLVARSVFSNNTVKGRGGAIWTGSPATLESVELTGNSGGGASGSTILASTQTLVARNITIAGDPDDSVIRLENGARLVLESSIVWGNGSGVQVSGNLTGSITNHSNIEGGWSGAGVNNIDQDPDFMNPAGGDYSLSSGSPCIDKGDPSFLSSGLDVAMNGRLLDGDLDGAMMVDMGAHEFAHVRLSASGNPIPGGSLTFDVTGSSGRTALLAIGSVADSGTLVPPYGPAFFDLGSPFRVRALGTLPAQLTLTIPAEFPTPATVTIQALVFGSALPSGTLAGNLSNPVTFRIQSPEPTLRVR